MKPLSLVSILSVLAMVLFSAACRSDSDLENPMAPRIMIEAREVNYGSLGGTTITLPRSGTSIPISNTPLVSEFEIARVDLVQVDLGLALALRTTERGARALYRASVTNKGSRVVLMVNGNAIGARRIDGAISDGTLYTFVEVDDEELGQLVIDMNDTLVEIARQR